VTPNGKIKIAIVGGGVGALTAAFELTEHNKIKELYDITVYTLGWRLGGKCAVGRNEEEHWRAEEHGLHVWAGFYDNAFDLVQRCYSGLGRPDFAWRNHFEGLNHLTIMERSGDEWNPWLLQVTPNNLTPGAGPQRVAPLDFVKAVTAWVWQRYATSGLRDHLGTERMEATRQRLALTNTLPLDGRRLNSAHKTTVVSQLSLCLEELGTIDREALRIDDDLHHNAILIQLGLAIARGIINDDVFIYGFDHIDHFEWSEWLALNGCTKDLGLNSAPVRACYDYVFGYVKGKPEVGAGTGTRALLRFLLNYKGSVLYTLRSTMGDFLFAPLYELLHKRNVKFEFFHRLDKLCLSQDGKAVDRIVFRRQVKLKNPEGEYCPLVDVPGGFRSWPTHPRYDQIVNGDDLATFDLESAWTDWDANLPPRTLELKKDFDVLVLAVGLGALKPICEELTTRYPKTWGQLLHNVVTTQTIGVQLWLKPSTQDLGWPDPRTVLTAFADPLNTWGDNSQLTAMETWPDKLAPGSLGYFVGTFPDADEIPVPGPDPAFPQSEQLRVKQIVRSWIETQLPVLWPAAQDPQTGFKWNLLVAPIDSIGPARLDAQYLRPNINPSDRYVLSVPGSVKYRLAANGSGVRNLYLAGDWVRTGLNAGCVEAAVMAGRAAARAITGVNMPIPGENDGSVLPISLLPIVNILQGLKQRTAGGVGLMDAYCAIVPVTASYVATKLPPGLHLAPLAQWNDFHPVILLFARQRHVRPGFMPFGGTNYHEFVELIPSVALDDLDMPSGGPFSYMPYLLLDQVTPVIIGKTLYGFNKMLARIRSLSSSYEIRCGLGEIGAHFYNEGLPGDISKFPNMSEVRDLMERPLISQTETGSWVYSYLDFCLDAATFQGISGHVSIGPPLIPPPPDDDPYYSFKSILKERYGAFRLTTNWNLSLPLLSDNSLGTVVPPDLKDFAATWSGAIRGRFRAQF
jgi:uncharacterized protein with NAD-binding domain and iron-sulfur cluster